MRVIVKYKKDDAAVYISHLDVQRSMQRTLKRSGLPIKYTMGFHPHVVLTFAQPLSVAVESTGEYMEFSLLENVPVDKIKSAINSVIAPGFYAMDCGYIRSGIKSLMSLVDMCEWVVTIDNITQSELLKKIDKLDKQDEILVEKHTKKGYRTVDIKGGIIDIVPGADAKGVVHMRLASGGKLNVSPKMVLAAMGIEMIYAKICRKDIYFLRGDTHYPLLKIGK